MTIDTLKQIYDDFLFDMNVVAEQRGNLWGALSNIFSGSDGSEPCTTRFADKAEKALAAFDFETEDAAEVIDFVLSKGEEYRGDIRLGMMMTAVQRFLLPFPAHISPEKAAEFLARYNRSFPKRELTPVMKEFKAALEKCAG